MNLISYKYKILEFRNNSKYTNSHLNGSNENYMQFILLTYRRTGSNHLLDLLRSHPDIVAFSGLYEDKKLGFTYPGYPAFTDKATLNYRNFFPLDFLKSRIFRKYCDNVKAVGFKVIYEIRFKSVLKYLQSLPNLKVIHLQRNNLLEIVISDLLAKKTGIWHIVDNDCRNDAVKAGLDSKAKFVNKGTNAETLNGIRINIDYDYCLGEFRKIDNLRRRFDSVFHQNNMLHLSYDELMANPQQTCSRVLNFLEVEQRELSSRFFKINNLPKSGIVINYDSLKKKFEGTEWYSFFDE